MSKPIETIGVIKESRPDENRTPLVPEHIEKLKSRFSKDFQSLVDGKVKSAA